MREDSTKAATLAVQAHYRMLLSVVSRPRGIALIAISSSIDDLRRLVEPCYYAQYGATCEKDQIVEICCDERIKENLLLCAIGLRLRPQSKRMSVEEAISIVTSSETAKYEATVMSGDETSRSNVNTGTGTINKVCKGYSSFFETCDVCNLQGHNSDDAEYKAYGCLCKYLQRERPLYR